MPPSGYLTVTGIRSAVRHVARTYPTICQLIELPERSHDNRRIEALKIAKGSGANRRGVLFLGGVHARELINPDLLCSLALRLCQAYDGGSGLTFGAKSFNAASIRLIVEGLDVYMAPLVNPDGRAYVQHPAGDAWWRKNRNPNPGLPCPGVDLNRNHDFLWSSGIGTSANSCTEVFKGAAAFSEPETRNVRHLLDVFPNIGFMIDVHSYSELILYPWGDDDNQTADPSMNFTNPSFDGLRGAPGDTAYREYIPAGDLAWLVDAGADMRDAIAAVRGRTYTSQQAVLLYPTSGTSKDYAYARQFVDATKRKVYAYTLETAREFQPPYSEALQVIDEASAGLVQFCLSALCAAEAVAAGTRMAARLDVLRGFRDRELLTRQDGRRYASMMRRHSVELMEVTRGDDELRQQAVEVLSQVVDLIETDAWRGEKLQPQLLKAIDALAGQVAERGSRALGQTVADLRQDLAQAEGRSLLEVLGRPAQPGTDVASAVSSEN